MTSTNYTGIYAANTTKYSGGVSVTTAAGTTVSGYGGGIDARNYGKYLGGSLSVIVNGDVTSTDGPGIFARNNLFSANLTITTAAGTTVSAYSTTAIDARNYSKYGAGVTTITTNGDVTSTNGTGIFVRNENNIAYLNLNTGSNITGNGDAVYMRTINAPAYLNIASGVTVNGDVTGYNPANGYSQVFVNGDFTTNGNFNVSGLRITGGNTLTISPGNNVQMYNMPASAGTFDIGVTDSATYGSITVNGGAVDLTGATITVNVSGAGLAVGDMMLIGDGTATITGGPGGTLTTVVDNSPLFNFQIADGTNALFGGDDTQLWLLALAPTTPAGGNQDVYDVLQSLSGSPDPNIQNALTNVNGAPDDAALNNLLNSLQPPADTGTPNTIGQFFGLSLDNMDKHLDLLEDQTGVASGNGPKGLGAWGQVFGQVLDHDARGGVPGYDAHTAGFTLGMEATSMFRDTVAGVSVSYGNSDVESDNANRTQTDIDSYQLSLYGQKELENLMYLRGMAAYAFNNVDTARFNVGGVGGPTALGDFSAHQYGLRLEAGRRYAYGGATLIPNILFNWTHYDPESYTETGAGGLNLTVRGSELDRAEAGLGLKAKWGWQDADGNRFAPILRAGYRYDLVGDNVEATSTFTGGGAAFTTQGVDPARSSFNAGGTLVYETPSNWEFQASYDADMRQDFLSHSGSLRAVFRY